MSPFTENNRYDYPLTKDSVVIDAGGYEGNFANLINEKYGCRVIVLEPVREFWMRIQERFAQRPEMVVLNVGIAGTSRKEKFGIKGDMSGITQTGAEAQTDVTLMGIDELMQLPWLFNRQVDLLKLNIEGCEFEVLEAILAAGMDVRFKHIQVQPHSVVPHASERWHGIRNRLLMNFRITSEDPNLDTGWLLISRK